MSKLNVLSPPKVPIKLRFLSRSSNKLSEAREILSLHQIEVIPIKEEIDEIQSEDTDRLVRDKLMKAFAFSGRALFVEHTGLYLRKLNGFPGGLTQVFWDKIQADLFSELFGNTELTAKTIIGYTDGRHVHIFSGEMAGKVASTPRGKSDFQWDCVFVPNGTTQTFAEMGVNEKNKISMRRRALDEFRKFLRP